MSAFDALEGVLSGCLIGLVTGVATGLSRRNGFNATTFLWYLMSVLLIVVWLAFFFKKASILGVLPLSMVNLEAYS
jgi:hypothetical protein